MLSVKDLNIKFFSEYTNKPPNKKNLFETCHTLPFNGINCLFWNPIYLNSHKFFLKNGTKKAQNDEENKAHNGAQNEVQNEAQNERQILQQDMDRDDRALNEQKENKKVIRINIFYYIVDNKAKIDVYFYLKHIKYTMRPFRGKIIGDLYLNENKIKSNISANGIINGEWKYCFPHIKMLDKLANITLSNNLVDADLDGNIIESLVIVDKHTYRPPLPKCFNEL
ncbi:conserved Plasmodium protein, unknown function [Plasmodium malariae]|uniref:Uncharacterized protein n=1 Tax=Plasmodium malariae TaxID=5858 RepID=A0A1C3L1D8_PLAMA|nr:conserved Plasmodium protein, unknown function [Plasmodium malariae]